MAQQFGVTWMVDDLRTYAELARESEGAGFDLKRTLSCPDGWP